MQETKLMFIIGLFICAVNVGMIKSSRLEIHMHMIWLLGLKSLLFGFSFISRDIVNLESFMLWNMERAKIE